MVAAGPRQLADHVEGVAEVGDAVEEGMGTGDGGLELVARKMSLSRSLSPKVSMRTV